MGFSTVHFGGRTINSPLPLFVDGFYEILRSPKCRPDIGGGGFVDDLTFWLLQLWHGLSRCDGLAGG